MDEQQILQAILADPRYQKNLDWGTPRSGHPEGSIRAHIAELEQNLDRLAPRLSRVEITKLRLLIHVHDTFKPDAREGAAIRDADSHASLARAFLAEHCDDADLLEMVQNHDEPYALWLQVRRRGEYSRSRMDRLLNAIRDWDLFQAFLIVDGCTVGKHREPLEWWFDETADAIDSRWSSADILADANET